MKTLTNTTATATATPKLIGFRVYFDNCGTQPHFSPVEVEDCNEIRPWTVEDDQELANWQDFEAEEIQRAAFVA